MSRRYGWLLLILLAGAFLRIALITEVPPGLTHDEADHGLDAWGVVNGTRPIYFTSGYGREPLYDYSTAGLMAFLGPTFLAGRLAAAFFSLIVVAGSYSWVSRAFDRKIALYTAAGLAVSFWAVMTGRQGLRSITMPAVFVLAAIFYWRAVGTGISAAPSPQTRSWKWLPSSQSYNFVAAGLLLGISLYTYIPARILWLLFPLMLPFVALIDRSWFSRIWRGTLLMLLTAGMIALPLLIHLAANPEVEVRLDELSQPLRLAVQGNLKPLINNIFSGLGIINVSGDGQWRYNIPGKPLLGPVISVLFVVGLGTALWRVYLGIRKRSASNVAASAFFALAWLALGLVPVLITGREFSTPRAVGIQPVLYLFPALSLALLSKIKWPAKWMLTVIIVLLFSVQFVQTIRQYFIIWGNEPEVRVQYESSLVATIEYLKEHDGYDTAISTTTPEVYHSPAVGFLHAGEESTRIRWFNGRHSLLIPEGSSVQITFSGFAPLSQHLAGFFPEAAFEEIPSPENDIDRPLVVYTVNSSNLLNEWLEDFSNEYESEAADGQIVQFGDVADLLGYQILTPTAVPGEELTAAALWRLKRPLEGAVMFTQLLGSDGLPITQDDRLDAPGEYWISGDFLIQLHQMQLPSDIGAGEYELITGIYTLPSLDRLPAAVGGQPIGDHLDLPPVVINP